MKRLASLRVALALLTWSGAVAAAADTPARYAGRALADVLVELESRGLKLVYSSALVRPHMRVEREPSSTSPRRILAQILASHGLRLQTVPGVEALAIVPGASQRSPESRSPSGLRVVVRSRGERLSVAHLPVRVLPDNTFTTTNGDGALTLGDVAPGLYVLEAHLDGFKFQTVDVAVLPQQLAKAVIVAEPDGATPERPTAPLELLLVEKRVLQETVEVSGTLEGTGVEPGPTRLPARQVAQLPGAVENVFRAVQALPGIVAANEFQSRVVVRGGAPDQNLTILDGLEIYNPFRLEGLVSAFNPDTVEDFALDAVSLPARYGDRLSSVLVIRSRDGRRDRRLGGSAALSLTDANVVLDGRLPASGAWLLTTRRTYYDLFAERMLTPDVNYPGFHDVQLKSSFAPSASTRLSFLGLRSRETAADEEFPDVTPIDRYGSRNDLAGLTLSWLASPRLASTTTVSAYRNDIDVDLGAPLDDYELERHTSVRDAALRQDFRFQRQPGQWFEAGLELHDLDTAWKMDGKGLDIRPFRRVGATVWGDGVAAPVDSRLLSTRGAGWVDGHFDATTRLTVELGTRFQWSSIDSDRVLLPRGRVTWSADDSTRLWAGAVGNAQSAGYEKQLQGDYFLDLSRPLAIGSERSRQVFAGFGRDLNAGWRVRLEAYRKAFDDLLIGRLETEGERQARLATFEIPADYAGPLTELRPSTFPVNEGTGRAQGVELLVERRASSPDTRLTGCASYTLARSERTAYGRTFPFDYDRRHSASVAGSVRLTPSLEVSASWRVASGLPYTPIEPDVYFERDDRDVDQDGVRDEFRPVRWDDGSFVRTAEALPSLAAVNARRLPFYSRLDFRASHVRGEGARQWEFYVDVINVLNRRNTTFIDLEHAPGSATSAAEQAFVEKRLRSLPFIPSFGIRLRF